MGIGEARRVDALGAVSTYSLLSQSPDPVPASWKEPCASSESTLHQLSPYIGKLKSTIARDLIEQYSSPGDLVVDPFCGSGTVPLEAAFLGRRTFASDVSPYARILSKAKLSPPSSLEEALSIAKRALARASALPTPDLRSVPRWVRAFFHPRTLKEAISFAKVCRKPDREFLLACLLGILHHQRPGFLSYPSSHLVPYLRSRKFPRHKFPELYEYRELRPRLLAKIRRAYKRTHQLPGSGNATFRQASVFHVGLPEQFGCVITSPPYMNALDYGRDNRLRLWFVNPSYSRPIDNNVTQKKIVFGLAISVLATKVERGLKMGGHCVLVVGERVTRRAEAHPAEVVARQMSLHAPSLQLLAVLADEIPDVRRSRRKCRGTKAEHFLVYQRK